MPRHDVSRVAELGEQRRFDWRLSEGGVRSTQLHTVYINHWPAANPSDIEPEEFRAFALRYERLFEQDPPVGSGYPHIVAATAWALSGSRDGCLRHLPRAIDIGWLKSSEQLRSLWPELFDSPGLEERDEWRPLFERLRAAS